MPSWHVAACLQALLAQLNRIAPRRSKVSDGSIGDAAHASRNSDHNPWYRNTVTARDYTHDPRNGLDCNVLAAALAANGDKRIKYIIWNRRIWQNGVWKPYFGANPHDKHLHLSVVASPACENGAEWNLTTGGNSGAQPNDGVLEKGDSGEAVKELQNVLNKWYPKAIRLTVDGDFGTATENAVKYAQTKLGITADGIAGKVTLDKLNLD